MFIYLLICWCAVLNVRQAYKGMMPSPVMARRTWMPPKLPDRQTSVDDVVPKRQPVVVYPPHQPTAVVSPQPSAPAVHLLLQQQLQQQQQPCPNASPLLPHRPLPAIPGGQRRPMTVEVVAAAAAVTPPPMPSTAVAPSWTRASSCPATGTRDVALWTT